MGLPAIWSYITQVTQLFFSELYTKLVVNLAVTQTMTYSIVSIGTFNPTVPIAIHIQIRNLKVYLCDCMSAVPSGSRT